MAKVIEIQILNVKNLTKDNGFSVRVLIDNEEKSVLELEKTDMLHIGAILLNASNMFIKNADKTKDLSNYGNN
jgi:hypothetical protein